MLFTFFVLFLSFYVVFIIIILVVTFIIIFMFDIFTSCCKMKNTFCFKKELYVVVVKVRAISLRKIQLVSNITVV